MNSSPCKALLEGPNILSAASKRRTTFQERTVPVLLDSHENGNPCNLRKKRVKTGGENLRPNNVGKVNSVSKGNNVNKDIYNYVTM